VSKGFKWSHTDDLAQRKPRVLSVRTQNTSMRFRVIPQLTLVSILNRCEKQLIISSTSTHIIAQRNGRLRQRMSVGSARHKLPSASLEEALVSLKLIQETAELLPPLRAAASAAVSIIGFIKVCRFFILCKPLELRLGRLIRPPVTVGMHLEHKSPKRSES
jgi:hypothetical protein